MTQSKQFLSEQQDVANDINQSDAYAVGVDNGNQIPQSEMAEKTVFTTENTQPTVDQPKVDINWNTTPQLDAPVAQENDNALAKALLAGAVGALVGTLAGALANKVKPETVNKTVKGIGDAVKGVAKGVSENVVGAVDALKDQVEDIQRPETTSGFNSPTAPADVNTSDNQSYNLYEERLVAAKQPVKTGEVVIGKHVETRTVQVSVPVDRERVFVERIAINTQTPAANGEAIFSNGEIARMEVFEEKPLIQKQAFVRETVTLRKEVQHNTASLEDNIRREELDLDIQGRNIISQPNNLSEQKQSV